MESEINFVLIEEKTQSINKKNLHDSGNQLQKVFSRRTT